MEYISIQLHQKHVTTNIRNNIRCGSDEFPPPLGPEFKPAPGC